MEFRLETERFVIRPMTILDAADMFSMNNDPLVIQYTGDEPFTSLEATKQFLADYYPRQTPGTGRWGIEERSTGQLMGWTGVKHELDTGLYDIGYRLFRHQWGRGIATEASAVCVRYAFDQLMINQLIGRVMPANQGSVKVLEKLGLVYLREDFCQHHPSMMYAMDRTRYEKQYHTKA